MKLRSYYLAHGSALILPIAQQSEHVLHLIHGAGRGCVLKSEEALCGIWIPLRGALRCGPGVDTILTTGELRITEPERPIYVSGRGSALWVAILGDQIAWQEAIGTNSDVTGIDPLLFPAVHRAEHRLRRYAVALARSMAAGTADTTVTAVIDSVIDLQSEWNTAISRCPGRSYGQRRQVFLRLQRVRNYMAENCHLDIDTDALARMASYSPWHFIRAFRSAYQQTPHAYLIEQRLWRARRLLRSSPLTIAEIAMASGFENRCAFSRLFRQRFGATAGTVRRGLKNPPAARKS